MRDTLNEMPVATAVGVMMSVTTPMQEQTHPLRLQECPFPDW
jgi:hypothetical protein